MLDDALTVVITAVVYVCVAALLAAIVIANIYAIIHAWRSSRVMWATALSVLFFTGVGGGVATAAYLMTYHHEPLSRSASARRHAAA